MINNFVKSCKICQMNLKNKKSIYNISPMRIYEPRLRWELDLIGSIDSDKYYILTCIDIFTRFAITRILKDKSASRLLNALENIFLNEKKPKEFLTDNGKEFTSESFKRFCSKNNIKILHSSPYTPTTTGAIERFNQSLINKIKRVSLDEGKSWKTVLQKSTDAYNVSPSRAHKFLPIYFKNKTIESEYDRKYKINPEIIDYEKMLFEAVKNVKDYQRKYEVKLKKRAEIKAGDKVWYIDVEDSKGKFDPVWQNIGVVKFVGYGFCKILNNKGKEIIVNNKRIKKMN